jgi:hypothetical protein
VNVPPRELRRGVRLPGSLSSKLARLLSWTLAAFVLWAVAACGGPGPSASARTPVAPSSPREVGAGPPASPPAADALELRLRGHGQGAITALRVAVEAVEVTADGAPLAVTAFRAGEADLGRADHAWFLGYVVPPAGARRLDVVIRLAPACSWADAAGSATCDARGIPIVLAANLPDLGASRHVVAAVEVEPSLLSAPELGAMLVPHYRTEY